MRRALYELAPQMRAYREAGRVYAPYLMEIPEPGYESPFFSTDRFGFRTTLHDGRRLALEEYSAADYAGKRGALVGNSTAFGVGATSDATTIASQLNQCTPLTWFCFAGRTWQSTQELIAYLLFAPGPVEETVIISGINNYDLSYRWLGETSRRLPPFLAQERFRSALSAPPSGHWKGRFSRLLQRLSGDGDRGVALENPFLPGSLQQQLFSETVGLEELLDRPNGVQLALATADRDLAMWVALYRGHDGRLTYILQPIPEWSREHLSLEEERLLEISEEERGGRWARISEFLRKHEQEFRSGIREIAHRRGIHFVDANEIPGIRKGEWIFIDRYHLTDEGQKAIADFIRDEVLR